MFRLSGLFPPHLARTPPPVLVVACCSGGPHYRAASAGTSSLATCSPQISEGDGSWGPASCPGSASQVAEEASAQA